MKEAKSKYSWKIQQLTVNQGSLELYSHVIIYMAWTALNGFIMAMLLQYTADRNLIGQIN